jgi:hypothetical protein
MEQVVHQPQQQQPTRQRRPGKEVSAARVREVANVLLDGAVPGLDVLDFIREREADQDSPFYVTEDRRPLSYSQCRKIIKRAQNLIGETIKQDREKLLDLHLARRRNLYAKAVAIADYRCALSILQDECELLGMYPVRRTAPSGDGQAPVSLQVLVQAIIAAEARPAGDAPRPLALESMPTAGGPDHAHEKKQPAEDAADQCGDAHHAGGGEALPEQLEPLREPALQDSCVE